MGLWVSVSFNGVTQCWPAQRGQAIVQRSSPYMVHKKLIQVRTVRAVQLEPPTPQEDPENLPKQPNKSTGPKPARKHVAKKSGAGQQKSDDKNKDKDDNSNQGLNVPP